MTIVGAWRIFMNDELRKQISLFRFGLISPLVGRKGLSRGEQSACLKRITAQEWDIPGSARSSIACSTVLRWLDIYQRSGCRLESLEPKPRKDRGQARALDAETEAAVVTLRKDNPAVSLPVFFKLARSRGVFPADRIPSKDSLYRLFKRHGLEKDTRLPEDRRKFEAELVNDLWQSDCMHGPRVIQQDKLRKSYLFAVIDDHSRLITDARFYLSENIDCYRDCLVRAFEKRGLPRRLYVDNGSAFRSNNLKYACARLGVALLHSRPYVPQGRGKIERFFLTVRTQVLPLVPPECTLEELNRLLSDWLENDYHQRIHAGTGQSPRERYLAQVTLLRSAPKDLRDYFRSSVRRKVDKDRTVTLSGKLYEAPVGLIGRTVTLLYHEQDPGRIEVFHEEASAGFLVPLAAHLNSRVRRSSGRQPELIPPAAQDKPRPGSLFTREVKS
jgi:putative transposase